MPIETDAVHAYDLNNKINPAYAGAAFEVGCNSGEGSDAYNIVADIGFDGNGKIDKAAIVAHSVANFNRDVFLGDFYDQFNGKTLSCNRNSTSYSPKLYDGATQSFVNEDENGNIYASFPGASGDFWNPDLSTNLATFSVFARIKVPTTKATDFTVMGLGGNSGHIGWASSSGSTSTDIVSNFGANSREFWNQTELFTRGELFTEATANDNWEIFSSTNLVFPTPNPADFQFGYGRFTSMDGCFFTTLIFYNGDKDAERTTKLDEINALYESVQLASGSVTFNDVAFSNGVVDFFSTPYAAQGAITKVEQVPIESGVATMTVERDPLKDYFGVARGMTQDFTGTLASAPVGDVISTGLDLTSISIGGANDDHYIFRATGGPGAGTEVTVTGRTGGDITVTDASAFGTGTEFTLGRFISGISRVLPKD